MNRLAIITAHAGADSLGEAVASWTGAAKFEATFGMENDGWLSLPEGGHLRRHVLKMDGREGMLAAYQRGFRATSAYDLLAFFHDDFLIHDPQWLPRVMAEFESPDVGLVGFGGALVHGSPEIYKRPYDYRQLGRSYYLSNTDDAEVHGERFAGSNDVAVLDGYALIVRRSILEKAGGWPVGTPIGYSLYDYWLACEAHRQGYRIRVVGLCCHHYGGRTAVALKKAEGQGQAHEDAHRWLYQNYSDVLPWSCLP